MTIRKGSAKYSFNIVGSDTDIDELINELNIAKDALPHNHPLKIRIIPHNIDSDSRDQPYFTIEVS